MTRLAILFLIFLGVKDRFGQKPGGKHQFDHIILAINNLDSGIQQVERLTGVKASYGGRHPDSLTENAIVSLGDGMYIEILAPRADADSVPGYFRQLEQLTILGWAIGSSDLDGTKSALSSANIASADILPGSRMNGQGELLRWETTVIESQEAIGIPFFISWHVNTLHPSLSAPKGCGLSKLVITSREPGFLKRLLLSLSVDSGVVRVKKGAAEKMKLILDTPKGKVRI